MSSTKDESSPLLSDYSAPTCNSNHKENGDLDAEALAAQYGIKTYGPAVSLAMTINYVIGTGCFGLPYAFSAGGILMALALLVSGIGGSIITMNYTLESLARANGVSSSPPDTSLPPTHRLSYRKLDFAAVGHIFGGKKGMVVVQTVVAMYGMGSLWSYASIFASSMASLVYRYAISDDFNGCDAYAEYPVSACMTIYYISMVIFSVIVISMVLFNVSEQASIQKFLSIYRIVALILMLATMATKISVDGIDVLASRYNAVGSANWSNFGRSFGPTLLALNCHFNMPDALQPLKPKSAAKGVALGAMCVAGGFYVCIGLLGALAFDHVNPLASLMWSSFTGCGNGWEACEQTNLLGIVVQLIVLLFPVVNVTSTYPMLGVTIGDNMIMSIPPSVRETLGPVITRSICRLCIAVPPLLLATFFKKLDLIFAIAGMFGFFLALVIPCWFQVISSRYCERVYGSISAAVTPYSAPIISNVGFARTFLILTFGITAVAVATI